MVTPEPRPGPTQRAEAGAGERRVGCPGLVFAKDPGDSAAAEFGSVLVDEHRMVITAGTVEVLLGQVGGQQRRSVGAERDVAGLASLAGQRGHGRVVQADVTDGQVGEFLDPGRGVIQGGQQGRVPAAGPGAPVRQGEQLAGLPGAQVGHGRLVMLAGGNREDVLAARHAGRVLGLHPGEKRVDRGQALVAGRRAVVPAGSQPVQEPGDGGGVDQLEGEPFGRDGPLVPEVADQQLERVTVGNDRVGRAAAQPGQVSGQEPAQEHREVSGHDAALP